MRNCTVCGKPTEGTTWANGTPLLSCCPSCKRAQDAALLGQCKVIVGVVDAVAATIKPRRVPVVCGECQHDDCTCPIGPGMLPPSEHEDAEPDDGANEKHERGCRCATCREAKADLYHDAEARQQDERTDL